MVIESSSSLRYRAETSAPHATATGDHLSEIIKNCSAEQSLNDYRTDGIMIDTYIRHRATSLLCYELCDYPLSQELFYTITFRLIRTWREKEDIMGARSDIVLL